MIGMAEYVPDDSHDVQIDQEFPNFKGDLFRRKGHSHPRDVEEKIEMPVKGPCRLDEFVHLF
ncbi:hypothetical protein MASR1M66_05900 [Aminivibrio sp.]